MRTLAEIGQDLRAAREARGRSLEEVASQTRMKVSHLRAIEEGDESSLPEPVYVKSFIRKYAQAVGLPADELANQYWETKPLPPPPVQKQEINLPWWIFPWVIAALLIGVVVYFMVVAPRSVPESGPLVTPSPVPTVTPASPSALPGAASPSLPAATGASPVHAPAVATPAAAAPAPASPHATPTVRPTATPYPTPTPIASPQASPTPTPAPEPMSIAPGEELKVRIVATEASWLRVLRDGREVYVGTLPAGQAMSWTANDNLNVSIGNAGGVDLQLGNRSLGKLGAKGEVVRRIFKRGE
ncbi:cytoskeletal protein RodZ [compost metagenome]